VIAETIGVSKAYVSRIKKQLENGWFRLILVN
jgi:DNA-directed RNA polymerase specialized sigma subunit